jgi:histidine ammonia-lyase
MTNVVAANPLTINRLVDMTTQHFEDVAWWRRPIVLGGEACARMAICRQALMALLDGDPDLVVYGVTSGYGQNACRRLTPEQRRVHARSVTLAPATGFGRMLPNRVVRGMLFTRLANFIEGHSAISPDLARQVAAMLDGRPLPSVPCEGHGGAGEIQPLVALFADLLEHYPLAEKEHLCLINGSPVATALLGDAVLAGRRRLALSAAVFALSIEAMRAPLDAYDEALDGLWGDPFETCVLKALRGWLDGAARARRPYQAPVSWRILPRVLGQAQRALAQAEEALSTALRAVTDNPVFFAPDLAPPNGRVFSTGGYHNAAVCPALDQLAASAADLALLADRHLSKLLDGTISLLPHQLLPPDDQSGANGPYLGCLGMAAVGYVEQARHAAQRTFLPGSEGGSFGANDIGQPTCLAWRKEAEAGRCLVANLALLAAVASQALHITGRPAPPALGDLLSLIRATFPPVLDNRRRLGLDAGRLAAAFDDLVFADRIIAPGVSLGGIATVDRDGDPGDETRGFGR